MSTRHPHHVHLHASSRRVRAEEARFYGGPHKAKFRVRHADHGTVVTGPKAHEFAKFLRRRGVHDPAAHEGWVVSLGRRAIDKVFTVRGMTAAEVKQSLVHHDGYPPDIRVHRERIARRTDPRKLTYQQRKRTPSSAFALPSRRKLNLRDKKRVKNAAARVVQMLRRGTLSSKEFMAAQRRIKAAACHFGVEKTCRKKLHGAEATLRGLRRGRKGR